MQDETGSLCPHQSGSLCPTPQISQNEDFFFEKQNKTQNVYFHLKALIFSNNLIIPSNPGGKKLQGQFEIL